METELEDVNTRLNSTISELEETQKNKEKVEQKLDEISSRLNSTLDELEEMSGSEYRTWDWNIFLSEEFLNRTFTTEDAQLLRSSWEDAAEWLVGYTITDKLIKILDLFDSVENRPWLMLYSENYIDKLFTRNMAKRLANIWDGISGKMVGVTMTKEVIELLNHITDKTNCGNGHSPDTSP
ncbi:uncharacterized protein LOC134824664 [Bolinopsis microptera]|uniref:uncharacterized protein LOC134824664 n=1 Tax=Bolinopsis microptera TaxID=2820187 RepID=UPI00307A94FA